MAEEQKVRLRVICSPLPAPRCAGYEQVELGIQEGEVSRPGVPEGDGLRFECEVRVKPGSKSGSPNFLGPFVFGTPEQRFLYLRWERHCAGGWQMFRRMKIHLSSITWEQIEAACRAGGVLEARVSGIGRDGTPACASVPLLGEGWLVGEQPVHDAA
jgi:hypothetical protein